MPNEPKPVTPLPWKKYRLGCRPHHSCSCTDCRYAMYAANTLPKLQAENEMLRDALVVARATIKAWHGSVGWEIYEKESPEMKVINAALKGAGE